MIKFQFLFSDEFLIEAYRKYRRQHKSRNYLIALKGLFIVLFVVLIVFNAVHNDFGLILFFIAIIFFLIFGHRIDIWAIKHRFRKSPYKNETTTITLSEIGFHSLSAKSETKLQWDAFTKAVIFTDGYLLFQGPGFFNWLPIDSIIEGTVQDLDHLIRANIKEIKVVK